MTFTLRASVGLVAILVLAATVSPAVAAGPAVRSPDDAALHQAVSTGGMPGLGTGDDRLEASTLLQLQDGLFSVSLPVTDIVPVVPAVAGYTRFGDSDPLEHETRQRLFDAVSTDPGVYVTELARETDTHVSTTRYHVRVLVDEGLIQRTNENGRSYLFPAHAENSVSPATVEDGTRRALLSALDRHGSATGGELAEQVSLTKSTVSYHLQRLQEDGLIDRQRDGRSTINALADGISGAFVPTTDDD
ncbi:winged helix-turn-helix transcriptional regulator [Haloarcula amylovorans]|uniref:winged helix-turn-helix transcriptional regulator n=1 Tax=Haloarcula amylovorans TaxID=2562280 RepID=UPI0010769113|nr:helix-turn-helix domain-containing protein [Halomicroarcula amylolytica]